MLEMHLISFSINQLDSWFMYALWGLIFNLQSSIQESFCIAKELSVGTLVKWIFCYLSGTRHLGTFYPKGGSLPPNLNALFYSNWACWYNTRMSTSGFYFMLGNSCISSLSKKQPIVTTYSCEAEYKAAFTTTIKCIWLRSFLADLSVGIAPTTIFMEIVRVIWRLHKT